MHLSRYTDYAYRVLLFNGTRTERSTLNEIGKYYDISVEHLRKVVHRLSQLGYLNTYKGKSGGMELGKAAAQINLGQIYREFENSREEIIDCTKLNCILNPGCTLKKVLFDAEQAFIAELDKYSLDDLLQGKTVQILAMEK